MPAGPWSNEIKERDIQKQSQQKQKCIMPYLSFLLTTLLLPKQHKLQPSINRTFLNVISGTFQESLQEKVMEAKARRPCDVTEM